MKKNNFNEKKITKMKTYNFVLLDILQRWGQVSFHPHLADIVHFDVMPAVAERLRRAYLALPERAGVGSIPANPDAQNVPYFRRWRFEMKLSPFCYFPSAQRPPTESGGGRAWCGL
jgi:hypothetical protein